MSVKRGLFICGGGAWDAYNFGALSRLNSDYDVVVSTFTSCLLAPLIPLKEWDVLKNDITSTYTRDFFDIPWFGMNPINKKGKIRKAPIIIALLFGKKSIYTSKVLRKTIDYRFSEIYFNDLKNQNKEVIISSQNFAQLPSKNHFFSSSNIEFNEYKDWMWCSGNFPFYGSLIKKSWRDVNGNFHVGNWSGGGVMSLDGIEQLVKKDVKEIDIVLTRVKFDEKLEGNKVHNLIENIFTSFNAVRYNIENNQLYDKIKQLNKYGIKVRVIWLPRKLSHNPMYYNPTQMNMWWEEGYNSINDENRIEIYEPKCRK